MNFSAIICFRSKEENDKVDVIKLRETNTAINIKCPKSMYGYQA